MSVLNVTGTTHMNSSSIYDDECKLVTSNFSRPPSIPGRSCLNLNKTPSSFHENITNSLSTLKV